MRLDIFGTPNAIALGELPMPIMQGVRQDSLVYPQELTKLQSQERTLYRPLLWRSIINVESVDPWAEQIEDRRWASQIEDPILMTQRAPTQELPMPALSTTNQFKKLFQFGLAYGVYDRDIVRAQKLGISLATEGLEAVNERFETFLENLAAKGHTATGMVGLGNLPDVSTVTKGTQASGTTWPDATTDEIVADLHAVCNAVEVESKQNVRCDTLVLSHARSFLLTQKRTSQQERTPMEVFKSVRPDVNFLVWDLIKDQGAGATQPLIGFNKSWSKAPKMLMQQEVSYLPAMRGTIGYVVPGMISTGGVRCLAPQVVCKMSGI
jgi:hypothetical protein